MKQLNRFFRPRILLAAMALAAAGSVGAQTTGTDHRPIDTDPMRRHRPRVRDCREPRSQTA